MEIRKSVAAGAIAGSLLVGGAVGAAWFVPKLAGAQTTTTPPTTAEPGNGTRFTSNEDPAHEAGESAEREATEDAGRGFEGHHRGPNGQFTSNEDTAHEASESAEREAAEDAAKAGSTQAPPSNSDSPAAPTTPATPAAPAT